MTNKDRTNPQEPLPDSTGGGDIGGPEQDKTVVSRSTEVRRDLELASTTPFITNRNKPPTQNSLVGRWLDRRFEILEVVGTGGMSVVYKARQDVVDRFVAIKTLKMQLQDQPETVQRFQREIKSLCRLSHPHIVTVFDCIIDDDGQPYIAMDFLDGKSLDAVLREKRRLSPEECLPFLVQICSALDHAHKHGIVHRDLKPSNIMLVGDNLEFVKVVDFGLAHLGQENQKITRSGEIWGSPPYMSPEQCSGQPCDGRSDIYSLGIVMYEMLSGRDPFTSEQIMNTLLKQLNEPPPPFPPHLMIPQTWQYIVFKCLEKSPADRYQTMGALKEVLTGIGKQQSVVNEVRTTRVEQLSRSRDTLDTDDWRRPLQQHATVLKATLVAVTIGAIVFIFSKMPMHRASSDSQPQSAAVEPAVSSGQNSSGTQPTSATSSAQKTVEPKSTTPAESPTATGGTAAIHAAAVAEPTKPAVASEQPGKGETTKSAANAKSKDSAQKMTARETANPAPHKPHVKHPAKPAVAQHPAHHEPGRHVAEEPHHGAPGGKNGTPWDSLWSQHNADADGH